MYVQLPDGTIWQDNGDGTWAQVAASFDDPAAAGIEPGIVEQVNALPGPQAAPPDTSGLPLLISIPSGKVFLLDGPVYRWVPDPDTFNALGLDWGAIVSVTIPGAAIGDNVPSVDAPSVPAAVAAAASAPPSAPSPVTPNAADDRSRTFVWGNVVWGYGDTTAFIAYLAAHGVSYLTWKANHPDAAAILEGPEPDPTREAASHSLGQALAAAIQGGDTPEQAAARVEALRAAQVKAGVSGVTPDQLLEDARVVQSTLAAAGGLDAAGQDAAAAQPDVPDTRSLQSLQPEPDVPPAPGVYQPSNVAAAWRQVIDFATKTLPANHATVQAKADALRSIFQ